MSSNPVRFTSGVAQAKSGPLRGISALCPCAVHRYFNDFDTYLASDWVVTETSAASTQALADGDGGLLVLTNPTNDDHLNAMQLTKMGFAGEAGKKMVALARIKTNDATETDIVFGFQPTDTTPLAATDGMWMYKADGGTTWVCNVAKSSTATTSSAVGSTTANTFMVLGIYYNGKNEVEFWIDSAKVATLATTNFPDGVNLTGSFAIQNGTTAAKTLTVDYVMFAKER